MPKESNYYEKGEKKFAVVDRSFAEALKGAEIKSQKNMELMDKGGLRVSKK